MQDLIKHRVSIHTLYFKICGEHESEYWKQDKELKHLEAAAIGEDGIEENLAAQMKAYEKREQSAVVAITFAAMSLEAFFFDYAADQFGNAFTRNHLDKLDLKSRFLIYPKLVVGKTPNKSGQAYEGIDALQSIRNNLVHFKSKAFDLSDLPKASEHHDSLNEDLRKGVAASTSTVRMVMEELDNLHGSGSIFSQRLHWSIEN